MELEKLTNGDEPRRYKLSESELRYVVRLYHELEPKQTAFQSALQLIIEQQQLGPGKFKISPDLTELIEDR